MSTIGALDANNAISSALQGMQKSSSILDRSANTVLKTTAEATLPRSNSDSISFSDASRSLQESASLDGAMVDTLIAKTTYTANAQIVKASDAMFGTLLNMLA